MCFVFRLRLASQGQWIIQWQRQFAWCAGLHPARKVMQFPTLAGTGGQGYTFRRSFTEACNYPGFPWFHFDSINGSELGCWPSIRTGVVQKRDPLYGLPVAGAQYYDFQQVGSRFYRIPARKRSRQISFRKAAGNVKSSRWTWRRWKLEG